MLSAAPYNRRRTRLGDPIFAAVAGLSGVFVLVLMGSLILSLFVGGLPAFLHFGPGFLTSGRWDPVHEVFGAAVSVYGTLLTKRHSKGAVYASSRRNGKRTKHAMASSVTHSFSSTTRMAFTQA